MLLACIGLAGGASVGREGPTVQVGAALLYNLRWLIRFPRHLMERGLIIAGGGAGVAAAFNTPLAGIVFAIEEMARSFEERSSGTLLTAVIIAGLTAVYVQGNYTYFGSSHAAVSGASGWLGVLFCGLAGGVLGEDSAACCWLFPHTVSRGAQACRCARTRCVLPPSVAFCSR